MAAQQQLTFRAGNALVSLAAAAVAEIAPLPVLTRVPRAPALLMGVVQQRGVVTPVLSTAMIAGSAIVNARPSRIVVLRRDPPLALAADSIETLGVAADAPFPLGPDQLWICDAEGARLVDLDVAIAAAFTRLSANDAGYRLPEPAQKTEAVTVSFLALSIAGQAYALPLDAVLEVGVRTTDLTPLPHAEPALLGVHAWRGQPTPLISLRVLLGLPTEPVGSDSHQVVVDLGDRPMAIAVDAVTGILRVRPDKLGPAPELFNLGAGEAQVRQVLRRADGPGIVAILTPADLLSDDRLRRWRDGVGPPAPRDAARQGKSMDRRLIVRVGAERYGLPLAAVREIATSPETFAHVPGALPDLLGVMSLRGRPLPVFDAGSRLGSDLRADRRIVVLAARGEEAGFAFDAQMDIAGVDPQAVIAAPQLDDQPRHAFPSATQIGESLVLLADADVLLDQARADMVTGLRRQAVQA